MLSRLSKHVTPGRRRGTHKVMAMPPVARIPQRIVLAEDMERMLIEMALKDFWSTRKDSRAN